MPSFIRPPDTVLSEIYNILALFLKNKSLGQSNNKRICHTFLLLLLENNTLLYQQKCQIFIPGPKMLCFISHFDKQYTFMKQTYQSKLIVYIGIWTELFLLINIFIAFYRKWKCSSGSPPQLRNPSGGRSASYVLLQFQKLSFKYRKIYCLDFPRFCWRF